MSKALSIGVTVGDGCRSVDDFLFCIDQGVSLVRMNIASRLILDDLAKIHHGFATACKQRNSRMSFLLDMPFPKLKKRYRTYEGKIFDVAMGAQLTLVKDKALLNNGRTIYVDSQVFDAIKPRDIVQIGDGELILTVLECRGDSIIMQAMSTWFVSDSKALTIRDNPMLYSSDNLAALRDVAAIYQPDMLALSFVESAAELAEVEPHFSSMNCGYMAKIETTRGVEQIADISRTADAIMVARGDLALYGGIERMGENQQRIIAAANEHHKPVYVATELFASLLDRPSPSRAELSDFYQLKSNINKGGFLLTKESSMPGILRKSLPVVNQLLG